MEPDGVAQRLEQARRERHLSITELARRARVPQSTLSSVKTGRRRGDNLTLGSGRRLATVLGISVDWLCGLWRDTPEREDGVGHEQPLPSNQGTAMH